MNRAPILLILVCAISAAVVLPCAATIINLHLYNSEPLLNSDASTPLLGNTSAGYLIQVILSGDAAVDPIDQYGNPTGNDTILSFGSTTNAWLHVGYGLPFNPDEGLLDVFPLQYDSGLAGTHVFVRFFNAPSLGSATYYGNSAMFTLPVGSGPGGDQAGWDFAPDAGSPHVTNHPITILSVVPEPSNIFLFGLVALGVGAWRKRNKMGIA